MNTDAATLRAEAANFDRIKLEIESVIGRVRSAGGTLAGVWDGQAGGAAQAALARFDQAGLAQTNALTAISENISSAGIQYTRADDDHASSLSSQMNF